MSSRFLNISTDNTLGGGSASDEVVSSQKAIKEYVDSHGGSGGTYPNILSYQWSDHLFNDMSWLRSDTFGWQDGTVYSTAYQHLVDDLNIEETPVITFGNPKVNPEITYTEYVATRSPENDVVSSGLYAWYDADYEILYYTQSENPAVNDRLYTENFDPYGYVVWTVTTEVMPSILPTIETVGSYSIVVYIAEDGHKIVLSDQEQTVEDIYDESGVAWYFILDTESQRFKLPRSNHGDIVEKSQSGTDGYRVYSDGWCEQWGFATVASTNGTTITLSKTYNDTNYTILCSAPGVPPTFTGNLAVYYNGNQTASSFVVKSPNNTPTIKWKTEGYLASVPQNSQYKYLYFYVGEFSQSAIEQTAGVTTETLNAKANTDLSNVELPHIVETYQNGENWYRVWSDGWCEQGGMSSASGSATNGNLGVTVNLLIPFKDTNFLPFAEVDTPGGSSWANRRCIATSTSTFANTGWVNGSCTIYVKNWIAFGYIS